MCVKSGSIQSCKPASISRVFKELRHAKICAGSQLRLNGRTPYHEMPRDRGNVFVIRKVRFIGALFSIHFAITGFKLLFVTM